jgi:hypothetical protein
MRNGPSCARNSRLASLLENKVCTFHMSRQTQFSAMPKYKLLFSCEKREKIFFRLVKRYVQPLTSGEFFDIRHTRWAD